MDLIILYLLARFFNLNKRRLFTHYAVLAVFAATAWLVQREGEEVVGGALMDTAIAAYVIFIARIILGRYNLPAEEEGA